MVATKADKKVIIKNKGGYIAHLMLDYTITSGVTKLPTRQTGSISLGQDYAFCKFFFCSISLLDFIYLKWVSFKDIPGSIDFNIEPGAVLTIDAVGGIRVLQEKIKADPECFHVWGTTLIPLWSTINCWYITLARFNYLFFYENMINYCYINKINYCYIFLVLIK